MNAQNNFNKRISALEKLKIDKQENQMIFEKINSLVKKYTEEAGFEPLSSSEVGALTEAELMKYYEREY